MKKFNFKRVKKDKNSEARAGVITTPHGEIKTPVFMPIGTQASVKTLDSQDLKKLKTSIILANTYHLYLRPGDELIANAGGLHKFMSWNKPILTDSGGYQVFSLNPLSKITEDGVKLKSYLDGSDHNFTPEKVIQIQHKLGGDIIMALDECAPYPCSFEYAKRANQFTLKWAERCKQEHEKLQKKRKRKQTLFGIVQGSTYPELRETSAKALADLDLPGYAIGGLSVGEPRSAMWEMLDISLSHLPEDKPRYLMGAGTPEDIIEAVRKGVDMFDCVLPTRNARNGTVFTRFGKLVLKNAKYSQDFSPIDSDCNCLTCRNYNRAYLRHLFQAGEITVLRLTTIHSLHFYLRLMEKIREAILSDSFSRFRDDFLQDYNSTHDNSENPG